MHLFRAGSAPTDVMHVCGITSACLAPARNGPHGCPPSRAHSSPPAARRPPPAARGLRLPPTKRTLRRICRRGASQGNTRPRRPKGASRARRSSAPTNASLRRICRRGASQGNTRPQPAKGASSSDHSGPPRPRRPTTGAIQPWDPGVPTSWRCRAPESTRMAWTTPHSPRLLLCPCQPSATHRYQWVI
jgi:hypothetical protein